MKLIDEDQEITPSVQMAKYNRSEGAASSSSLSWSGKGLLEQLPGIWLGFHYIFFQVSPHFKQISL